MPSCSANCEAVIKKACALLRREPKNVLKVGMEHAEEILVGFSGCHFDFNNVQLKKKRSLQRAEFQVKRMANTR